MYSLCDRKVLRVVFVPCGMSALLRVACLLLLVPGSCARKTLAVSMPSSHGKNFKTRTWVPCLMTDAGVKSVSRGIRGGGQPQVDNGCSRTESGDESDGEMPGIAKEVKGDDGATAAPECSVKDIVLTQRNLNAVKLALDALSKTNSTMVVAPTGSGKTLIISSVIFTYLERIGFKGKVLVLAHRTYLLDQLEKRFHTMYPNVSTGQFRSDVQEWEAGVIFAMVPTLQREHHLQSMPTFDLVVVDECHHTPANSWARIIEHVWALNATCRLFGTTATPIRGDKKPIRNWFPHISDQITTKELETAGRLAPVQAFVIDFEQGDYFGNDSVESEELDEEHETDEYSTSAKVRPRRKLFEPRLINDPESNNRVVSEWQERAGSHQTIVFCKDKQHARDMTDAFNQRGIKAVCITSGMPKAERSHALETYTSGVAQVLVNVNIFSEGFDDAKTTAVVLLRHKSHKGLFVQMVGRGRRACAGKEFCVLLDFGRSTEAYKNLDVDVFWLLISDKNKKNVTSSDVGGGHGKGNKQAHPPVRDFRLRKFHLNDVQRRIRESSFKWFQLPLADADHHDGCTCIALAATSFGGFACICMYNRDDVFYVVSKSKATQNEFSIGQGNSAACVTRADALLQTKLERRFAGDWHDEPATDRQMGHPAMWNMGKRAKSGEMPSELTKYEASLLITFHDNRKEIELVVTEFAAENAKSVSRGQAVSENSESSVMMFNVGTKKEGDSEEGDSGSEGQDDVHHGDIVMQNTEGAHVGLENPEEESQPDSGSEISYEEVEETQSLGRRTTQRLRKEDVYERDDDEERTKLRKGEGGGSPVGLKPWMSASESVSD